MVRKTEEVSDLVRDVLRTMGEPFGEDIILEVFLAIQDNPDWQRRYDYLVRVSEKDVPNNWIGRYTKELTGMRTVREVDTKRSKLIRSYSKLAR